MRKEVIIVILVGIAIGAIVTFGIYTAQTAIQRQQVKIEQSEKPDTTPSPADSSHFLQILEPANELVTEEEDISITGQTSPNAVIAIIAQESEYLLTADNEGTFSAQISLSGGANQITISSFDGEGNKVEEALTVVYSTAEL